VAACTLHAEHNRGAPTAGAVTAAVFSVLRHITLVRAHSGAFPAVARAALATLRRGAVGEQECVAEHVWAVLQNIRGAGGEGETVMQEHTDAGLVLRQLQK